MGSNCWNCWSAFRHFNVLTVCGFDFNSATDQIEDYTEWWKNDPTVKLVEAGMSSIGVRIFFQLVGQSIWEKVRHTNHLHPQIDIRVSTQFPIRTAIYV